jgi:hypothetical protein
MREIQKLFHPCGHYVYTPYKQTINQNETTITVSPSNTHLNLFFKNQYHEIGLEYDITSKDEWIPILYEIDNIPKYIISKKNKNEFKQYEKIVKQFLKSIPQQKRCFADDSFLIFNINNRARKNPRPLLP